MSIVNIHCYIESFVAVYNINRTIAKCGCVRIPEMIHSVAVVVSVGLVEGEY